MSVVMTAAHPEDVNAGASTVAETTREFVARCQAATNVFLLCFILWRGNRRIRGKLEKLRKLVSSLTIEDEDERTKLREPARRLGKCVDELDVVHGKWVGEIVPRIPSCIPLRGWFGPGVARQLEELACMTEDIAETLALAASGDFAQLVRQELDASDIGTAQGHETAWVTGLVWLRAKSKCRTASRATARNSPENTPS